MLRKITIICIIVFCTVSDILGMHNTGFNQNIKSIFLGFKNCSLDFDNGCSKLEYCDEETMQCHCLKGYDRVNITKCIKTEEQTTDKYSKFIKNEDSGSVTIYVLTPLILLLIAICGIYMNRKYHITAWVKKNIHRNHENYDEFMIGNDLDDDDPPLH